ncbi:NAD-dependent succinate-semialdehyde dehydrogenase [Amylibacter sp. IMCC11727]|uniref:NAD-dependent succinate-semialdehyde dehydrogenase n=1 Tax=Amylibacter sp. IMCC11727 TaxID=3039851 RepID=UPI00244E3073|nr:NAD-dependent succinate-semialdehyde dehydrogenase [Amylibacter sp. IMCC11727]WGI23315.1 NAD-dependent succinate-semialdehyde dehydrogenase [Amylibacter sp. IMCC11727]
MHAYPDLHLYIDGKWRKTAEDMPVVNPATEQEIGRLPVAGLSDLQDAVAAAEKGFEIWRNTAPRDRADVLMRAAALLRERQEEIAQSITAEHGKPLTQARLEVIRGCEFFEWDAGEATRLYGRVIPSATGTKYTVHHRPLGVVAGLSPWNFPMSQPARKIAGAIASGCSIILKAAEETPAGAMHIVKAFHDAGLPDGVLNLVFGKPAMISDYLIRQESVRLVAFTGSTAIGRQLTTLASEHMTPVLMELGGHAPVIVCEDTDVQKAAISGAVRKMRNAGQVCTSPTRFFVHENIFDEYVKTFVERAAATVVGDGTTEGTEMGPLANDRRVPMLTELVEDARSKGATVATGGAGMDGAGYFFQPTVLTNVPDNARVMQEEPFGPLAVINPVSSLEEAIEKANSVPFGLAAYGFTNRADYIDQMSEGIEAGNVSFNTLEASLPETPFGGVKSSGYGREGGTEGLHNYTYVKNISHSMDIV